MASTLIRRPGTLYTPAPAAQPARRPYRPLGPAPTLSPPTREEIDGFRNLLASLPVAHTLELDRASQRIRVGNRWVRLAKREWALLLFLIQAAPDLVTRDEIARHVWGDASLAASRTIDVHVARLRDKAGNLGLVLTERGRGYRLNPDLRLRWQQP